MKNRLLAYMLITALFLLSTLTPVQAFAGSEPVVYAAASAADMENIIFTAIKNREEAFKISYDGNTDDIMNEIKQARSRAVQRDPYEEGCISLVSGFSVSSSSGHADIFFDSFKYHTTKEQELFVDRKVQEITASIINFRMSDYQKEKAIHDYILQNVSYDNTLSGYTAYSALYNGLTVCNGYVQLAYRLFNAAGIENMIVKGIYDSRDHEWNLVKLDNNWYHLDCTLDDSASATGQMQSYKYFNLTDSKIRITHEFDSGNYPPAVTEFKPDKTEVTSYAGTAIPSATTGAIQLPGPEETVEINSFARVLQPSDKVWTLKFNQAIDFRTVNDLTAFVVDSSGNVAKGVTFKKGPQGNILLVQPPAAGYESGKSYCIYILKGVVSGKTKGLEKALKILFTIK
ncbi:transglutaminase domain-containing protein [Ruminiclostridium hungatei]|nr:transglutaminase domain-containing protein [Ruminiclostridium hungatei]